MSVGKPIIMAVAGDAADLIRDAGAGVITKPGDANDLAKAALQLAQTPQSQVRKMGQCGQKFYNDNLSISLGVAALVRIFLCNRRV
jgi:glycosyltransferase involved in cell wall biosynthesis